MTQTLWANGKPTYCLNNVFVSPCSICSCLTFMSIMEDKVLPQIVFLWMCWHLLVLSLQPSRVWPLCGQFVFIWSNCLLICFKISFSVFSFLWFCVCAFLNGHVYMCAYMCVRSTCTCAHGGHKLTSNIILQEPFTLFFEAQHLTEIMIFQIS